MANSEHTSWDVVIIGAGYVGLSTACSFVSLGLRVASVDVDSERVQHLRNGVAPFQEPNVEQLMRRGLTEERLLFTDDPSVVADTDVVFLAVPTPRSADGSADISYIQRAVASISDHLRDGAVVVNKSTVPVGTADQVAELLADKPVHVASNPEFLREGSAVMDFLYPDRIVVGAQSEVAVRKVLRLFDGVDADRIITDTRSAELIKYAANGFLSAKISFANELSALCEQAGANLDDVLEGVGSDRRIGHKFLAAGPGWGGSCFPKDTLALLSISEGFDYEFDLIRAAVNVNRRQYERMLDKIIAVVGGDLDGVHLAAFGLTFKAGTDDMRDSPAVQIINGLCDRGATVGAYDPAAPQTPLNRRLLHDNARMVETPYDAACDAVAAVVLTEWPMFASMEWGTLRTVMAGDALIDLRSVISPTLATGAGFRYIGLSTPAG